MTYLNRVTVPSEGGTYERKLSVSTYNKVRAAYGKENANSIAFLITAWTTFLSDAPSLGFKPNRVYNDFFNDLIEDPFGVIAKFAELADELQSTVIHSDRGTSISHFIPEMKGTPVFKEYLTFYRTLDDTLLRYLNSFLLFGKKIYQESANLDATALRGWYEVEERLESLELPDFLENLSDILKVIFEDWEFGFFLPKHGSGSVAERGVRGSNTKNSIFLCEQED